LKRGKGSTLSLRDKRNVYEVRYVHTTFLPDLNPFVSKIRVPALRTDEAERVTIKGLKSLALDSNWPEPNIDIIDVEDLGPVDAMILDRWYKIDPHTYMLSWEPDQYEDELVQRLRQNYPMLYDRIVGTSWFRGEFGR